MKIHPLYDRICAQQLAEEQSTPVAYAKEKPIEAFIIISAASGKILETGTNLALFGKAGESALICKAAGSKAKLDGRD